MNGTTTIKEEDGESNRVTVLYSFIRCSFLVNTALPMRFPQEEWTNALKYYRQNDPHDASVNYKKLLDDDKENRS